MGRKKTFKAQTREHKESQTREHKESSTILFYQNKGEVCLTFNRREFSNLELHIMDAVHLYMPRVTLVMTLCMLLATV